MISFYHSNFWWRVRLNSVDMLYDVIEKEEHPVYLYKCLSGVCECMWVLRVKAELVRYSGNLSFILGVGLNLVFLRKMLKNNYLEELYLFKIFRRWSPCLRHVIFGCSGFLLHQRYTISIFVDFIFQKNTNKLQTHKSCKWYFRMFVKSDETFSVEEIDTLCHLLLLQYLIKFQVKFEVLYTTLWSTQNGQ